MESRAPAWNGGGGWYLADSPVLDLTATGAGVHHEFYGVQGLVRLADGRLVVAVRRGITVYSADGGFLSRHGRRGEGPGEYQVTPQLARIRGDSVVAFDHVLNRLSIYGPDFGDPALVHPRVPTLDFQHLATTSEGFVLMGADAGSNEPGWSRLPVPFFWMSRDGASFDTLGTVQGTEMVTREIPGGYGITRSIFGAEPYYEVRDDDAVVVGDAVGLSYRVVDLSGRTDQVVRGLKDLELRDEHIEAETRALLSVDGAPPTARKLIEDLLEYIPSPPRLPGYLDLKVDAQGAVWLQEHLGRVRTLEGLDPVAWEVFDRDGRWLGQVDVPGRFDVHEIGEDYVLGVWRDELDVEHVQLLELIR